MKKKSGSMLFPICWISSIFVLVFWVCICQWLNDTYVLSDIDKK